MTNMVEVSWDLVQNYNNIKWILDYTKLPDILKYIPEWKKLPLECPEPVSRLQKVKHQKAQLSFSDSDWEKNDIDYSTMNKSRISHDTPENCSFCSKSVQPSNETLCCKQYKDYLKKDVAISQSHLNFIYGSKQSAKKKCKSIILGKNMKSSEPNNELLDEEESKRSGRTLTSVHKVKVTCLTSTQIQDDGHWVAELMKKLKEQEESLPEPPQPVFITELPELASSCWKKPQEKLIKKLYDSGKPFFTRYSDGTGHIYYPSGNLAILISGIEEEHWRAFYVYEDKSSNPCLLALFDSNGNCVCYQSSGLMRCYLDVVGGILFDDKGSQCRNWTWRNAVSTCTTTYSTSDQPNRSKSIIVPIHPIVLALNQLVSVRIMAQDKISLCLSNGKHSCRFNVGTRLKIIVKEHRKCHQMKVQVRLYTPSRSGEPLQKQQV
ncbi:uncharacterized protein LOC111088862 isoform X2 [Limulus polyphemus]|uniref:Uncharacterized protein LOC111088862 isoform X2 n=1 Tax=Limulus polyphemus TaxID=6850 RepID=A0ABM1TIL6_LIMPO|nr:uncharacterized protein LOC111088862 isoform X2 [Limulus polyphemus]